MNKLIIVTLLIIVFGLLFAGVLLIGRKKAKATFMKASMLEDSGKAEDACYTFALAAKQGASSKECNRKIISIWTSYGPFDFSAQLKQSANEFMGPGEGHGEGYHESVVDYIQRALSSIK